MGLNCEDSRKTLRLYKFQSYCMESICKYTLSRTVFSSDLCRFSRIPRTATKHDYRVTRKIVENPAVLDIKVASIADSTKFHASPRFRYYRIADLWKLVRSPSRAATSGSRVPSQRSVAAVRAITRAAKSQRDPRTSATGALLGHSRDPRQFAVVPFQPSASNLSEKSFRWESHVAGNQTPSHLCRAIWGGAAGPAEEDVRVVPLLTHAAVVSVAAGLITTGHTTTSAGRTPEGKGDPRNSAAAPIPAGRVRPPMMNWRRRENWRCPTARTWS